MVTWLDVHIDEKDKVKALGAKWDRDERKWFVPDGMDITPFLPWLPKPKTRKDKAERFRQQNLRDSRTVEWQKKQPRFGSAIITNAGIANATPA